VADLENGWVDVRHAVKAGDREAAVVALVVLYPTRPRRELEAYANGSS
jgi:hypothetical protein